jgi:molybdopterin-guanine dinucleotide biosynthesis protein A
MRPTDEQNSSSAVTHNGPDYDLVVLAGGRSRRMGGVDELSVPVDGRSSLDRLLAAAPDRARVIAVGPTRRTERPVTWCREVPAGGGPLAAIAAALPWTSAGTILVAAGDMPRLGEAFHRLVAALEAQPDADVAALCDANGVRQPLAAIYRRAALVRRLESIGDPVGRPARLLLHDMVVIEVTGGASAADCDTWTDIHRITEELRRA